MSNKILIDRSVMEQALEALNLAYEGKCRLDTIPNATEALRAALENQFNPDWDMVEALQECLREHMAEIQRLRAVLAQPAQEPVAWRVHTFDYGIGSKGVYAMTTRPGQVKVWVRNGWAVEPLFVHPDC